VTTDYRGVISPYVYEVATYGWAVIRLVQQGRDWTESVTLGIYVGLSVKGLRDTKQTSKLISLNSHVMPLITHFLGFVWFLSNVNSCSRSLYAVARPSVVHPTHAVEIFGNISTAFGT